MVWSPRENDDFFGEPQEREEDAATMCIWCEKRVSDACKSHYDTLTCTHRVIVPTAEEWDSAVEAAARKPCTCDGAGRGPGRACVVKAGGRLGDLWRCADGLGA